MEVLSLLIVRGVLVAVGVAVEVFVGVGVFVELAPVPTLIFLVIVFPVESHLFPDLYCRSNMSTPVPLEHPNRVNDTTLVSTPVVLMATDALSHASIPKTLLAMLCRRTRIR